MKYTFPIAEKEKGIYIQVYIKAKQLVLATDNGVKTMPLIADLNNEALTTANLLNFQV